jgi:hypothetical protein
MASAERSNMGVVEADEHLLRTSLTTSTPSWLWSHAQACSLAAELRGALGQ